MHVRSVRTATREEPKTDEPEVLVETRDRPGTATVTLNRPERRNAWTVGTAARLLRRARRPRPRSRTSGAIVLTGAGGSFCPGADTQALQRLHRHRHDQPAGHDIEQPEWFPSQVRKPVIAAIAGRAPASDWPRRCMCDLRIVAAGHPVHHRVRPPLAAADARRRVAARAAGRRHRRDTTCCSPARTFDGAEAHRLGVATEVTAPGAALERAQEIAADLATSCSPSAMAAIKDQLVDQLARGASRRRSSRSTRPSTTCCPRPTSARACRASWNADHPYFPGLDPALAISPRTDCHDP